ncbi:MAG: hypothetical protein KGL39_21850 [Patescibacteria group bacterium]|nr:hypothetical protein [Patescibacteria group bacterium]
MPTQPPSPPTPAGFSSSGPQAFIAHPLLQELVPPLVHYNLIPLVWSDIVRHKNQEPPLSWRDARIYWRNGHPSGDWEKLGKTCVVVPSQVFPKIASELHRQMALFVRGRVEQLSFGDKMYLSMAYQLIPTNRIDRVLARAEHNAPNLHYAQLLQQIFIANASSILHRTCEHCLQNRIIWLFSKTTCTVCEYCRRYRCARCGNHDCGNHPLRLCRQCQNSVEEPSTVPGINPSHTADPISILTGRRFARPANRHYLGVELEYETKSPKLTEEIASYIQSKIPKKFIVKRDGSLAHGGEICTLPLELSEHADLWGQMFELLPFSENAQCDESPRTGLHTHISRQPASLPALARFSHFIESEAADLTMFVAGRRPNGYARYQPWRTFADELKHLRRDADGKDKYEVVNSKHPNTLEIRAYKSTKIYESMMARLQYTYFTMLFCEQFPSRHLSVPHFLDWLQLPENRNSASALIKYLSCLKPRQCWTIETLTACLRETRSTLHLDTWLAWLTAIKKENKNEQARIEARHHLPPLHRLPASKQPSLLEAAKTALATSDLSV